MASIQSTVETNITASRTWADTARAEALDAISGLQDIDFPTPSSMSFGHLDMSTPGPPSPENPAYDPSKFGGAPPIPDIDPAERPRPPSFTYPLMPAMLRISLPDVPVVEFPEMDLEPPTYTLTPPFPWTFEIPDIGITDDPMVQACLTRLRNNIEYGGTGLTPEIEQAIWDRDKERSEQQLIDSTDKTTRMWAKKGFSLPDGMLAHALSEIQNEYMNKSLDRSREIAIKQAELEQSNIFKSLELGIGLAFKIIDALIKYAELVFQGQEATAKFANEYIDLQIKTYASLLDAFKAKASVYESGIRAELAKVEIYKAQIQGQETIVSINESNVKLYSEYIRSIALRVDVYKSEVDAMSAWLGVEKAKVETNKIQMDAWAEKAKIELALFGGKIDHFKSWVAYNVANAEFDQKLLDANLQQGLATQQLNLKAMETTERSNQAICALRVEAAKGIASAAASLAAGAMAGVTSGSSMGYNEGRTGKLADA